MAGPKYYEAFKDACLDMIRRYGVNHFKFDGIATGSYASGGGEYILDTEAMRRLMLELRREDPTVYINLTTGSWPSPFWLRYADSLWRQGPLYAAPAATATFSSQRTCGGPASAHADAALDAAASRTSIVRPRRVTKVISGIASDRPFIAARLPL